MTTIVVPSERVGAFSRHAMPTISGPILGDRRPEAPNAPTAQDIAKFREQAYQAAYAEGLARAYAETAQRVKEEAARLCSICDQLSTPLASVDDGVVESVTDLAIMIAKHLIRRELKHTPGEVVGIVREAMRSLPLAARRARIYLHPDDLVLVQEALAVRSDTTWQLEADPLISRGGCVVETESSRVDAQVESRIAALISKMMGDERGADRDR